MIWLIISLPIISASVMAQSSNGMHARAAGADDVDGFFRGQGDPVTLTLTAEDQATPLTPDLVGMSYKTYTPLFSDTVICHGTGNPEPGCTELTGAEYAPSTYACTCVETFTQPFRNYRLYTLDAAGTKHFSDYLDLYPDKLPPQASIVGLSQTGSSVTLTTQLSDTACSTCGNICSGVREMEIYSQGSLLDTLTFDKKSCSFENTTVLDVGASGDIPICVKVKDKMHNGGTDPEHESPLVCKNVTTDFSAPGVCPDGSFRIMQGSEEVTQYSTGNLNSAFTADVLFHVDEEHLARVEVDAHELHLSSIYSDPFYGGNYLHLTYPGRVSCTKAGTGYDCRIPHLLIMPGSDTLQIQVKAKDLQDNEGDGSCTDTLTKDDTKPVSTFLGTSTCDSDRCYIRPGRMKFLTRIDETGSGFGNGLVFFDLNGISTAYKNDGNDAYWAYQCDEDSGVWTCYGYGLVPEGEHRSGDTVDISLHYNSIDDAGNSVTGVTDAALVYDDVAPSLVEDVSVLTDAGLDFYTEGSNLEINARLTDDVSGVERAVADFSSIKQGLNHSETTCTKETVEGKDEYRCSWLVSQIEGPVSNAELDFTFYDIAGNSLENSTRITVLENQDQEVNFWDIDESNIVRRPDRIDKTTMTLNINQRIYFSIPLRKRIGSRVKTLQMHADCGPQTSTDFLLPDSQGNSIVTFNDQQGSTNPFILMTLKKTDVPMTEGQDIDFDCTLTTQSRKGLSTYPAEEDNFTISLKFYNQPLGELDKNVMDEVYRVKNSDLVSQKGFASIQKWEKIVGFGQSICTLLQTITITLNVFGITMGSISAAAEKTGILAWLARLLVAVNDGAQIGGDVVMFSVHWICAAATCTIPQKLLNQAGLRGVSTVWGFALKNPESSIITSVITLCIPGIIQNLKKARAVECRYISCLRNEVKAGMPVFACTSERGYNWCKYVYQQRINSIPFVQMLNTITKMVREALRNPLALGLALLAVACAVIPNIEGKTACQISNNIGKLGQIYDYVMNFDIDKFWSKPADVCTGALEGLDDK
ncbi:MAG: hypothetical protein GXP63_00250 [DPANN group archaeon]|nr:hypothetical protein [DPANN group archaeon]